MKREYIYAIVMGERFAKLPQAVRTMHQIDGNTRAIGSATVTRGKNILARMIATIMRFPPAGEHALHVDFSESEGVETWTRNFGKHRFKSHLSAQNGLLEERFGPMRFRFDLPSDETGLQMVMRRWSIFHIPMPLALAPRSEACEWQDGEDFCFDVPVALPLIGDVVHYHGRLRKTGKPE